MGMSEDRVFFLYAVVMIAVLIVLLGKIIVDAWLSGKLAAALADGSLWQSLADRLVKAQQDTAALDVTERGLKGTVIAAPGTRESVNRLLDWLETLTPSQVDVVLNQLQGYFNAVTDGKPNLPSAPDPIPQMQIPPAKQVNG